MSMLTHADAPPPSSAPSRIPLPLVGGTLFGIIVVLMWVNLASKWVFYLLAGIGALAALPVIAILLRGRVDRFFVGLFIFSLQFYLSFNLVVSDRAMPGGVQGLNVSLQFLLAVAYFVIWRFRGPNADQTDVRGIHPAFQSACIWFLGLVSLSILNTTTRSFTVYGIFYHLGLITVALAACHICSSRVGLQQLWNGMWALAITQSCVLLMQRMTNISFSMTGEIIDKTWGERYGGTLGIAPVSVATLLMGLVLFSEMRLLRGGTRTLLKWAPAGGLALLTLLLSLTRSAWIGCGIGSVVVLGWLLRSNALSPRRGMMLAVGAMMALVLAYGPVRNRLDSNHQNAAEERWRLNYVNLEMMKAHPIIGIGLNTAYDSKQAYLPSFFTEDDWIYIAHNQYLLIGAEAGIVGLIAFLRILWIAIKSSAAAARAPDSIVSETGAVLLAYMIALVWGMNLDFYGGMQVYVLLWFFFGCAAGVCVLARREAEQAAAAAAPPV